MVSDQWLVGKGTKQWSVALEKEDWKEGREENEQTGRRERGGEMLGFAGIVGVFARRGMVEVCLDVSSFGYSLNPTYGLSEKNGRGNRAPTVPLFGRLIARYKCTFQASFELGACWIGIIDGGGESWQTSIVSGLSGAAA